VRSRSRRSASTGCSPISTSRSPFSRGSRGCCSVQWSQRVSRPSRRSSIATRRDVRWRNGSP
jgi:hypothetical protein